MRELQIQLTSLEDTRRLGEALAVSAELPLVVALRGTLGAGKTQLVRYVAQALGVAAEDVTSPTYVLLQRYNGQQLIYHFDFYRLESAAEVWDLGIDELIEQSAILFVEWAENFRSAYLKIVCRFTSSRSHRLPSNFDKLKSRLPVRVRKRYWLSCMNV